MAEIDRELRRLHRLNAQTERRLAASELHGRVTHVDHDRRMCRVKIGSKADGADVLSPWVRWSEPQNGFVATHTPLQIGDPVVLRSPSGVLGTASIAERTGYSGDHPAPSNAADAAVERTGELTITRRADGLEIAVGGTSWAFDAAGLHQTGGAIDHDGHPVDKSHLHKDVTPGGALTGTPV